MQMKSAVALSPALVETYARMLVYTDTESIGNEAFICTLNAQYFIVYEFTTCPTFISVSHVH